MDFRVCEACGIGKWRTAYVGASGMCRKCLNRVSQGHKVVVRTLHQGGNPEGRESPGPERRVDPLRLRGSELACLNCEALQARIEVLERQVEDIMDKLVERIEALEIATGIDD